MIALSHFYNGNSSGVVRIGMMKRHSHGAHRKANALTDRFGHNVQRIAI
jgi:hypothetical protein